MSVRTPESNDVQVTVSVPWAAFLDIHRTGTSSVDSVTAANAAVLTDIETAPRHMHVRIRTGDKGFDMCVPAEWTIGQVLEEIERLYAIKQEGQTLARNSLFALKQDEKVSYAASDGDTLYMVPEAFWAVDGNIAFGGR